MSAIGITASIDRKLHPQSIEPARNIDDDMFAVEEQHEESSRMPDRGPKDYLSDQDSIEGVINRMSREDDDIEIDIKQVQLKLQASETECLELKQKLTQVE